MFPSSPAEPAPGRQGPGRSVGPPAAPAVHAGRGGGEETGSAGETEEAGGGALQQAAGQRAAGGVSQVCLRSAGKTIGAEMEGKARKKRMYERLNVTNHS